MKGLIRLIYCLDQLRDLFSKFSASFSCVGSSINFLVTSEIKN